MKQLVLAVAVNLAIYLDAVLMVRWGVTTDPAAAVLLAYGSAAVIWLIVTERA